MKYLHTMIRILDPDAALDFFVNKMGMKVIRESGMACPPGLRVRGEGELTVQHQLLNGFGNRLSRRFRHIGEGSLG